VFSLYSNSNFLASDIYDIVVFLCTDYLILYLVYVRFCVCMWVHILFFLNFIRLPGRVVPGGLMFCCCFLFLPRDLQALSADCCKTLPCVGTIVKFCNLHPPIFFLGGGDVQSDLRLWAASRWVLPHISIFTFFCIFLIFCTCVRSDVECGNVVVCVLGKTRSPAVSADDGFKFSLRRSLYETSFIPTQIRPDFPVNRLIDS